MRVESLFFLLAMAVTIGACKTTEVGKSSPDSLRLSPITSPIRIQSSNFVKANKVYSTSVDLRAGANRQVIDLDVRGKLSRSLEDKEFLYDLELDQLEVDFGGGRIPTSIQKMYSDMEGTTLTFPQNLGRQGSNIKIDKGISKKVLREFLSIIRVMGTVHFSGVQVSQGDVLTDSRQIISIIGDKNNFLKEIDDNVMKVLAIGQAVVDGRLVVLGRGQGGISDRTGELQMSVNFLIDVMTGQVSDGTLTIKTKSSQSDVFMRVRLRTIFS